MPNVVNTATCATPGVRTPLNGKLASPTGTPGFICSLTSVTVTAASGNTGNVYVYAQRFAGTPVATLAPGATAALPIAATYDGTMWWSDADHAGDAATFNADTYEIS
jgi:hypothetical protein